MRGGGRCFLSAAISRAALCPFATSECRPALEKWSSLICMMTQVAAAFCRNYSDWAENEEELLIWAHKSPQAAPQGNATDVLYAEILARTTPRADA